MFKFFKQQEKIDTLIASNKKLNQEVRELTNVMLETNKTVEYQTNMIDDLKKDNKILTEERDYYKTQSHKNAARLGGISKAKSDLLKKNIELNSKICAMDENIKELIDVTKDKQQKLEKLNSTYKKQTEELNNKNEIIGKLTQDKNSQNEIIIKLNEELKRLKNKPNPPTIEELQKDKLFHGRRNRK